MLPVLLEQGDGGSIVNVSTIEAFRAIPTRAVYSAFKAAITGFTRSLAVEYARYGVRVNAIAPDVTETLQVPYSKWVGPEDEHLIPTWVPLGRFGQPDDLAGVALFLASELSAFVTGTTVHVDGGTLRVERLVPDRGGRMDESTTATLTRPADAPALVDSDRRVPVVAHLRHRCPRRQPTGARSSAAAHADRDTAHRPRRRPRSA